MLLLKASPLGHVGYFLAWIQQGNKFREYLEVIKDIPSRQWDKTAKVWTIGLSDYWILREELDKRDLKLVDIDEPLRILLSQYKKWEQDIFALANQDDCELCVDESLLKMPMMPHQRVALKFMLERKIALNGSEMGTGKTYPAIVCAKHLYDTGKIRSCLVVCIASVKWNWAREIDKCVNGCDYTVIEGDQMTRAGQYMSKTLFKIVNYEILRNDIDVVLHEHKFDCIIVDEIHRIRTHNAQQTKALYNLGKSAKYRYGLTGTPLQNKLKDLYSVLRFIHPKLLGEWWPFERRYCIRGYFGEVVDYQNLKEVHQKLKTVMIRKMKKDVLKDLPPKVYNDIFIELGTHQRKFYDDVRRKILESDFEEIEEKVKQANILANITYLREVCDSAELIDPEHKQSEKLKELKRIVSELIENGHKVVVFSQFKRMVEIIARDLGYPSVILTGDTETKQGVRQKLIDEFESSQHKNVFLMTTAGGEGINLQMADYIIFFDLGFNPQVIAQIEDRLHRKGQTASVNVIRLIAKDTIEERVLEILKYKADLFKKVIDGEEQPSGTDLGVTQKEILKALEDAGWG